LYAVILTELGRFDGRPAVPEWWTTAQLAEYIQVDAETLRHWRYQGIGPKYAKVGQQVRYRRAEVDRWLAQQERASTADAPGAA
jgi:excisionase family DNA binding protein